MTFAVACAISTAPIALAEEASNDPKPEAPAAAAPSDTAAPGDAQVPAENAGTPAAEQSAAPAAEMPAVSTQKEPPPKPGPAPAAKEVIESGLASVYSSDLEGRPTASGAPYDSQQLTAAHRSLPLGSQIRVTDAASGRSVKVTVNDRWGGGPGQVVNLSRRAADELGMRGSGQRKVDITLETLGEGRRAPAAPGYTAKAPQLLRTCCAKFTCAIVSGANRGTAPPRPRSRRNGDGPPRGPELRISDRQSDALALTSYWLSSDRR